MRNEYDIENLNPKRNPYTDRQKKQITINIDNRVIEYFKGESEASGIPYQTLISLYLTDCAVNRRKLRM
ncbi:MAG: BrnA antitoxin family protein [Clostridiales bacterium]|nr:BrnA antitoxin family protein [Clostridiales bacterium]